MDKYYRIRQTAHPDWNGSVIRINKDKLEVIAGADSEIECELNAEGKLVAKEGYFLTEIPENTAMRLREDEYHWMMLKAYAGSVSSPVDIPGTPEYAHSHGL